MESSSTHHLPLFSRISQMSFQDKQDVEGAATNFNTTNAGVGTNASSDVCDSGKTFSNIDMQTLIDKIKHLRARLKALLSEIP